MIFLIWVVTLAPLPWPVTPVMGATFTVNTTADTTDASPGNGNCADSSNNCSLRAAIMEANAATGADTIVLQSGQTYTLSLGGAVGDEDSAAEDDLDIVSGSTITIQVQGSGVATITRSGGCNPDGMVAAGEFRIFEVHGGMPGGNLTLQNVTVTNGCADGSFPDNSGGGILNNTNGAVTLTNSTISGNSANGSGGGIFNDGTLTLTNSTISGNSANFFGGGIFNGINATITLTNSTISGNSAGFDGGGILNDSGGTVTITNSTISGNSAGDVGGGIINSGTATITNSTISGNSANFFGGGGIFNDGTLTLTNSTISGNSANDDGGGILNTSGGMVTLTNSTISGNSANDDGGGIWNDATLDITDSRISGNHADGAGGGIYNDTTAGNVTITDSTISDNSANNGGGIRNGGGATMMIEGSTISDNRADDAGGGIRNVGSMTTITLTNSTISGNSTGGSSGDDGGGISIGNGTVNASFVTIANNSAGTAGQGGGIFRAGGTVNIKNSIVGNNTAGTGPNCGGTGGTFTPTGANLATDTTNSCGTTNFTYVPSTGAGGLNLGPLQVNAPGTTATHALLAGSAAVDFAADCTFLNPPGSGAGTDQRGVIRSQGNLCDVGAYEARGAASMDGGGHCLFLDPDAGSYQLIRATPPGGIITGQLVSRLRGSVLSFQNRRGEPRLLKGTINFMSGRGSAAMIFPLSQGGGRAIITDSNILSNPTCP